MVRSRMFQGPGPCCVATVVTFCATGHRHIDILKIDIEGWEFETLSTLITSYISAGQPLPFGQLQLEIHIWDKTFTELLHWWQLLESAGLRPFMSEVKAVGRDVHLTCSRSRI